jgi:uncharacterized repeat protein (TIGR03803 family)
VFRGGDGAYPYGGAIVDQQGTVYGTTSGGGRYTYGTLYEIDSAGNTMLLHSFHHHEGCDSFADLLLDKRGNLFGTENECGVLNLGTVYELKKSGKLIVLYSWGKANDNTSQGYGPRAGLIRDDEGNLYGTTSLGGTTDNGTVFEVNHETGSATLLYSFGVPPDGSFPTGSLIRDKDGNLYGTTEGGGAYGFGTVFKLDQDGVETILYSFTGGTDGRNPVGALTSDNQGNLYGTTSLGGFGTGFGTVFKLDMSGSEIVLHSFGQTPGDGSQPLAGLVRDSVGNLYGTTQYGGMYGEGTVFKLDPSGSVTILHSFAWGTDGAFPNSGLVLDAAGSLYGTTVEGGDPVCDCGTVFKIVP